MAIKLRRGLVVALLLLVSACDSGVDPEPVDEISLDQQLTDLLTKNGQRSIRVFRQPASDDLAAIPQDPNNPLTPAKVALGQMLFHETGLGTNPAMPGGRGTYGCATCHHAGAGFQAGRRQAIGDGGSGWGVNGEARTVSPEYGSARVDVQPVRSPSVLNTAYQDVMHWDGSVGALGQNQGTEAHWDNSLPTSFNYLGYDGLETQAIAALTVHRMGDLFSSPLYTNTTYRELWDAAWPGDSLSAVGAGLAIAAYERTLFANRAPFQRWLSGDHSAMTDDEKRGAIVFFGESECETCHTGPGLSGPGFYALGIPDMRGSDVIGTIDPVKGRGGFIQDPTEHARFKIPQLYNLKDSPFYGHGGTFESVFSVVEYYNDGLPEVMLPPGVLESRFRPLGLTATEMNHLTQFLEESLHDPELDRYVPSALPSGNCFPVNDAQSRRDLGCE